MRMVSGIEGGGRREKGRGGDQSEREIELGRGGVQRNGKESSENARSRVESVSCKQKTPPKKKKSKRRAGEDRKNPKDSR
jgi:hypothetical protein